MQSPTPPPAAALSAADHPRLFAPGTPIGLHLRVERLIRVSQDRVLYLVNNLEPRWYATKCWACGNKHSPPTAQACTYCSGPLGFQRLLMTSRWDPSSNLAYHAYVHRRLSSPTLASPVTLYQYREQLLSFFPWEGDNVLINEPAALPSRYLLSVGFQIADALHHLHQNGVHLASLSAANVLISPDGTARLFDLNIHKLVDRSLSTTEDPTRPPMRDVRRLAALLSRWLSVEDEELRDFFRKARRGGYHTADAFASGISHFAHGRPRPKPGTHAASQTDAGVVRTLNEDNWGWQTAAEGVALYAVADGMGGHQQGDAASAQAIRTLLRGVRKSIGPAQKPKPLEKVLGEAFAAANTAVRALGAKGHTGTTLVAMLVADKTVVVGNVGDSRAYLLRDGYLEAVTEDHSMVAAMVAAGKISKEEARNHPKSNVLLNYLGANEQVEPDFFHIEARKRDRFLLCSDGLWGELSHDQIRGILDRETDPRQCARRLVRAANDAGGKDNVTVLIVDIPA